MIKKKKSEPTTVCFSLLHAIIIKGKWTSLDFCLGFRPPWHSLTLCAQLGVDIIWGQGLPWRLGGKESTCDAGDAGSIPGLRRSSGEGNGSPLHSTPVFLLGKSHGQRSLAGYSPWNCKRVRHDLVTKQQRHNLGTGSIDFLKVTEGLETFLHSTHTHTHTPNKQKYKARWGENELQCWDN